MLEPVNLSAAELAGSVHLCDLEAHRPLEDVLREEGLLDEDGLEQYRKVKCEQHSGSIARILAQRHILSQANYVAAFCKSVGLPYINIENLVPDEEVLANVTYLTALKYNLFPVALVDGSLVVAFEDPSDPIALNAATFDAKHPVVPIGAPADQISACIEKYYESVEMQDLVRAVNLEILPAGDALQDSLNLEKAANQQPVVKLVNGIIHRAIKDGASDINIRPGHDALQVYYRIDGQMLPVHRLNLELLPALTSRIKIIANLDIAERRLPQDGHISVRFMNRDVDLRVSVIPTVVGESTVIRVLDSAHNLVSIDDLDMDEHSGSIFRQLIQHDSGILLVTGPTGSGKSTTLYAVLNERRLGRRHIITVEDPVEYHIEGVEQIQVHNKIGYTFAEALRHILRHDPDDILIGEMRDTETAAIAVKASLTGHFVMSTLHTQDAITAVDRLTDMGMEPYLIASSLTGVLAQRLVRRLCTNCRVESYLRPSVLEELRLPKDTVFWRGEGCAECHGTGYHGRHMVCEILAVSPAIRRMIAERRPEAEIRDQATREGMRFMRDHAIELARKGVTSLEEALAVRG